jgi:hypothetical protein
MKKILLLLALAIVGVSCVSGDFENAKLNLDNLSPFIEKKSTIKEGLTTRIYADDKLICETNVPISYLLPKGAIERIEYVPSKKDVIYGGWDTYQFTACFEDTRNGDNDYNDFVCFITRDKSEIGGWPNWSVKITMYIQPVAYGAGTILQFGMTLPNGQDTILTTNIQRDLFPGTVGFVNTTDVTNIYQTSDVNHIIKFTYIQAGRSYETYRFHPFIINQYGEKLYVAINGNEGDVINYYSLVGANGYPLGIATSGIFEYPLEKINISTCYPDFNNWIMGNTTQIGNYSSSARNNVFYRVNWGSGGIINNQPQNLNWN